MQTDSTSEHLSRLKELIAFIADPNVRLAIEFAALEFGSERYAAGIVDARESPLNRYRPPSGPTQYALIGAHFPSEPALTLVELWDHE